MNCQFPVSGWLSEGDGDDPPPHAVETINADVRIATTHTRERQAHVAIGVVSTLLISLPLCCALAMKFLFKKPVLVPAGWSGGDERSKDAKSWRRSYNQARLLR